MKPKYQKQTKQPQKERDKSESDGTNSKLCKQSQRPEPRDDEYRQESTKNGNFNKLKNEEQLIDTRQKRDRRRRNEQKYKNRGTSDTASGLHNEQLVAVGQGHDEEKRKTMSELTYKQTGPLSEKFHTKTQQETLEVEDSFTNGLHGDKLPYRSDNKRSVTDRRTRNVEKTKSSTISRQNKAKPTVKDPTYAKRGNKAESHLHAIDKFPSPKLEEQSSRVSKGFDAYDDTFDIDDEGIKTAYNIRDQKWKYGDLPSQPRGLERRKELPSTGTRKTSLRDLRQKLADIYRALVHVKAENVSLAEVTDVMATHARIYIDHSMWEDLASLFEQNEDKFAIAYRTNEPLISVKTDVAICSIFTNDTRKQHECQDLHVCKYFLLSKCSRKECKFGHNLSTKHNKNVLRAYSLDGIEKECKISLIQNLNSRNVSTMPLICKFYNNEGDCKNRRKCTHLHICKHFINGDCKFGKKCIRCHNILNKHFLSVLERHGLVPDSRNYNKIIGLLKDTLDEGEVVLKKNIQPNRGIGTSRKQQSCRNASKRLDTSSSEDISSDESNSSNENYIFSGNDVTFSESEYAGYESASENTTDDENVQRTQNILGNGQTLLEKDDIQCSNDNGCNRGCFDAGVNAQMENKQYRIRAVKGHWEIANKQGVWIHMNADESDRFSELHSDFIKAAENIIANSRI